MTNASSWRNSAPLRVAIATSLLLIGAATLMPASGPRPNVGAACLLCGDIGATDVILNVLLFLPLGIALGRAGVKPLHALGLAIAISGSIEIIQHLLPGRSSTWRDVLMNAIGAWLGALLACHLATALANRRLAAAALAIATAGSVGIAWVTGTLLAPDVPPGVYYVHWVPRLRHLEPWTGSVTDARIGELAVPPPRLEDTAPIRPLIRAGARIEIAGRGGRPTERLGGIITLSDEHDREVLLVGVQAEDLVVRVRRRAAVFRLDAPDHRFRGALPRSLEGEPITIAIDGDPVAPCASVNGHRSCAPRPTVGRAWALLRWLETMGTVPLSLLDAVTFAALAFPVGLVAAGVPRATRVASVAALVGGVSLASGATGLAMPGVLAMVAGALGLVAGLRANVYCIAHWSTRRPPRDPGSR